MLKPRAKNSHGIPAQERHLRKVNRHNRNANASETQVLNKNNHKTLNFQALRKNIGFTKYCICHENVARTFARLETAWCRHEFDVPTSVKHCKGAQFCWWLLGRGHATATRGSRPGGLFMIFLGRWMPCLEMPNRMGQASTCGPYGSKVVQHETTVGKPWSCVWAALNWCWYRCKSKFGAPGAATSFLERGFLYRLALLLPAAHTWLKLRQMSL